MSLIYFQQMEKERKEKINMTMERDEQKIFMIVPWSTNSNTHRWFTCLKEAVDTGKKLKEEDERWEDYDVTILLYDGTVTFLSQGEIEELLVIEETKIKKDLNP